MVLFNGVTFQFLWIVDCKWAEWSEWSCCSQTCAEGVRTRTRNENQIAQNGGKPCLGKKVESESCHYGPCPGKILENVSSKQNIKPFKLLFWFVRMHKESECHFEEWCYIQQHL